MYDIIKMITAITLVVVMILINLVIVNLLIMTIEDRKREHERHRLD